MSFYLLPALLLLSTQLISSSVAAAAAAEGWLEQLQQHQLYNRRGLLDDSEVHEEFSRKFSKRRLTRAIDDLFERLMKEEEECRQEREQCADDGGQEDQEGQDQGGQNHGKPEDLVAPPTKKPDTDHGDHGNGQGQGHGQDHEQEHGQGEGQGQGQGGGDASPGKKFYIESKYNQKVLEIPPGDALEGAKIQMWDKRGGGDARQLWVVGEDKFIRSAVDHSFEFTDSSKKEDRLMDALRDILNGRVPYDHGLGEGSVREGDLKGLEMHPFKSHYNGGRWRYDQDKTMIINEAGFALTIRDASRDNGARLIQHEAYAELHKEWNLVPAD